MLPGDSSKARTSSSPSASYMTSSPSRDVSEAATPEPGSSSSPEHLQPSPTPSYPSPHPTPSHVEDQPIAEMDNLAQLVPHLLATVTILENELKETKQVMSDSISKLLTRVKTMEDELIANGIMLSNEEVIVAEEIVNKEGVVAENSSK